LGSSKEGERKLKKIKPTKITKPLTAEKFLSSSINLATYGGTNHYKFSKQPTLCIWCD